MHLKYGNLSHSEKRNVRIIIVKPIDNKFTMSVFGKFGDIIGGVFLASAGFFMLILYSCIHKIADNWFIAILLFVFLLGMGFGAIALGMRRIFLTIKGNKKLIIKNENIQKEV